MPVIRSIIAILLFAVTSLAANFYASPTGTGSTCSLASPCSLQTAFSNEAVMGPGDTLWLRGGTYYGKYLSTLDGGTVRSYTGEWAVIDGYVHTTLAADLDASSGNFTVVDGTGFMSIASDEIEIEGEILKFGTRTGNSFTGFSRAASGSIGPASAHATGSKVTWGGNQIFVQGSNTTYRDFEIKNSNPYRDDTLTAMNARGAGVSNIGASNSFINLIVHDNLNGIFTSDASSNTTIYGCLVYNNGTQTGGTGVAHGHGFYLENGSGYSHVYDDLSLNAFNLGAQFYGVTAAYVGGSAQRSLFANAGAPLRGFDSTKANYNLIYGPDASQSPTGEVIDSYFFHQHDKAGYNVSFGYGSGITTGTFTGNYVVGGGNMLGVSSVVTNLTLTGNKFYTRYTGAQYIGIPNGQSWTWNSNTYYKASGATPFGVTGVGLLNFTNWKSTTGFDAAGSETGTDMPDTVIVNPNAYETGRANVIIYAPSAPSVVAVNLSTTGLTNGQGYTVHNAFDYFGTTSTGIYSSASPIILVSMTGSLTSVATPVGFAYTPATTVPDLAVLIITPNNTGLTCYYWLTKPSGCP